MRATVASATGRELGQVDLALVDRLGDGLRILACLSDGVADVIRSAAGEHAALNQVIHHHVGQRDVHLVHAVDAEQAADRALNGNGRVYVDEALGVGCNVRRACPRLIDEFTVQVQFALHCILP